MDSPPAVTVDVTHGAAPLPKRRQFRFHSADQQAELPLHFCGPARASIHLPQGCNQPPSGVVEEIPGQLVNLPLWPLPISQARLSQWLDGLIIGSAILLFAVVSLVLIRRLPGWLTGILLLVVLVSAFTAAYELLFRVCIGTTAGKRLAQIAAREGMPSNASDLRPRTTGQRPPAND